MMRTRQRRNASGGEDKLSDVPIRANQLGLYTLVSSITGVLSVLNGNGDEGNGEYFLRKLEDYLLELARL